jgi:hypothetical protein
MASREYRSCGQPTGAGRRTVRVYRGASYFATRAAARVICAEIDALPARLPVTVDWSGVDAVTGAFADEYVKWMLGTSRSVSHEGMGDDVLGALALARQRNSGGEAGA